MFTTVSQTKAFIRTTDFWDEQERDAFVGYTKAKFDNLPTDFLLELRKEIDHAQRR